MKGDSLARGAKSATFQPAQVSQKKWDSIWAEEEASVEIPANRDKEKSEEK